MANCLWVRNPFFQEDGARGHNRVATQFIPKNEKGRAYESSAFLLNR